MPIAPAHPGRRSQRLQHAAFLAVLAACQGDHATNPAEPEPPPAAPQCEFFGIAVHPAFIKVEMGKVGSLTVTFEQRNCTNLVVAWATADSVIARVSQAGDVTGVWPGVTGITATVQGRSATAQVTVTPAFPAGRVQLTHLPVDPVRMTGFFGLGELSVLPKDHGAFLAPPSAWYLPPTIPVYAPGDGWIEGLIYDSIPVYGKDLSMRIRYSTTITTNFGHMSDFAPEIWAAAGELQRGYAVDNRVWIPVRSGQVVGYCGTSGGMDFYIGDEDLQLRLLNPGRYPGPWLKAGQYFDYFDEPLKSQLLAITIRQDEPRGGRMDYDVPGRIIGNWFLDGNTQWDRTAQLAIVYDFIDGTRIAIADGSTVDETEREAHVYWVEGNAPRPEDVGQAEGLVKYEIRRRWFRDASYRTHAWSDVLGTFLVEMIEPGRIRVETVLGKSPSGISGFSSAARIYVR